MNPPETSEDRDNIGGDRNFVNDDNSDNTRNNMEDVSDDRMNSDQSQGQFPFQNNNNQNLPINSVVSKDTIKDVNPFSIKISHKDPISKPPFNKINFILKNNEFIAFDYAVAALEILYSKELND